MKDNRLKEQVFKDLREALIDRNDVGDSDTQGTMESIFPIAEGEDPSVVFAQNFTRAGGTMFYCYNEGDIKERLLEIQHRHDDIIIGCASENLTSFLGHLGVENRCTCDLTKRYPLGATLCEALIAWQGSVVISSNLGLGTTIPSLPEATVVLAFTSQVVADWEAANERLKQLYPQYPDQLIVTNPRAYAYRKGMQKLYLILIEDETN